MHERACVGACRVGVVRVCVSVPLVPSLPSATHKISNSDNACNRGLILEANQSLAALAQREPTPLCTTFSCWPYHRSSKQKMQQNQVTIKGHLARRMYKVSEKQKHKNKHLPILGSQMQNLLFPVWMNPFTLIGTSHREVER